MTDEWSAVPGVAYRLTDDEAKAAFPNVQRPEVRAIVAASSALQILNGTLWIHRSGIDVGFGVAEILAGILLFLSPAGFWWSLSKRRRGDLSVRFDATGVTIHDRRTATVPWRHITTVTDAGPNFLFARTWHMPLIIPKRVFPDSGAALWSLLEDRLIAKRSLQRRVDSRIIVNTAHPASSFGGGSI